MRLHDWIYEIVNEICYDREYVYPCFIRHFGALMREITEQGGISGSGEYAIPGIKSGITAGLTWQVEHRLNWVGSNVVSIKCVFEGCDNPTKCEMSFEMSSGERLSHSRNRSSLG